MRNIFKFIYLFPLILIIAVAFGSSVWEEGKGDAVKDNAINHRDGRKTE